MTAKTILPRAYRAGLCTIAMLAFVATLCATGPALCAPREGTMKSPYRILFLGDSITYGGLFIDYIEACLLTRVPGERLELINLGLPSETLSGLSEPGHAGGAFPRPDLAERLDRTLEATHPNLVFACYGMNDGIYFPLSEERFAAFRNGIENLVARLNAHSVPFVLLTPPPFDPLPILDRTTPLADGEWPGHGMFRDYDQVLAKYSTWLLERRKRGWHVIDLHGPMTAHLSERRRDDAEYTLTRDGVHQNAFGHWLMAQQVMTHYQAAAVVDAAQIDVEAGTAIEGDVSGLAVHDDAVSFSWSTKQPLPMDVRWDPKSVDFESIIDRFNRHQLIVKGAPADEYRLYEGDALIGVLTREELAAGINLVRYPQLSTNQNGPEILRLIRERQALLTHAWLTDIGHTRPGLPEGLPVAEATDQAADLEVRIRELAGPMRLDLRLVAVTEAEDDAPIPSFPGTKSEYRGFDRYDFTCDGVSCLVVTPKAPAPGNPWVWRAEFFDHRPEADLALLARGFHLAYIQVGNTFGCPDAMAHWDAFYRELTETYGLSRKPALEGLSRGGLYCYNWAAANPNSVGCIYGDAPVCDFKSWPGGKGAGPGSPGDWAKLISDYHFASEAEALAYDKNPVDNLAPLAEAKVPLLHVYGDADETVPWTENTAVIKERYEALGGSITLICKPGVGHHPHALEDPTPIVEFILKHASGSGASD